MLALRSGIIPQLHPPQQPTNLCSINGLTHVNLTKLDVLSGQAEIKVGVAYRTPSGQLLHTVPEDLDLLEQCEVRRC
jgi:adenylosuccinate synthase